MDVPASHLNWRQNVCAGALSSLPRVCRCSSRKLGLSQHLCHVHTGAATCVREVPAAQRARAAAGGAQRPADDVLLLGRCHAGWPALRPRAGKPGPTLSLCRRIVLVLPSLVQALHEICCRINAQAVTLRSGRGDAMRLFDAARLLFATSWAMTGWQPVQEAAAVASRRVTLLRRGGAGGDHPLDPACPEGEYLSNLLFRVM